MVAAGFRLSEAEIAALIAQGAAADDRRHQVRAGADPQFRRDAARLAARCRGRDAARRACSATSNIPVEQRRLLRAGRALSDGRLGAHERSSPRRSPGVSASSPARRPIKGAPHPATIAAMHSAAPTRSTSWAACRRSRRWRSAPRRSRRSTCWSAPATPMSPRPSASSSAGSASTCSPARPRSWSSPTTRPTPRCAPPTCSARPSTARPRRRSC